MLPALALAGLSAAGSFMSSKGAADASAKQGRLQMMEDYANRQRNDATIAEVNKKREALGRELLTIPEESGSWVDIDGMMAAADRAGINPITFLNAGGLGAYQMTWRTGHNASDAFKMMLPEYALSTASQVPTQSSSLAAFGGALSAGANAFGTQMRADMSYEANMARVLAAGSIQGMGLSSSNGFRNAVSYGGGVPQRAVAGLATGGNAPAGKDEVLWPGYEQPPSQTWDVKKPEATNVFPPSWGWVNPPGWANADSWENSFGEPVSWPYGLLKLGETVIYNTTGKTTPEHFRTARQQVLDWKAVTPNMTRYSGTPWSNGSMSP